VAGVSGTLATTARPDGAHQITYNGAPLYTFALDTAPDQTKGNGTTDSFGGKPFTWHALVTSGGATAPSPSTSGGGYGNY
jgi:predicted lipoprotein with Yx(FWY)xxD motif